MADLVHADTRTLMRSLDIHRPLAPGAFYRSRLPLTSISSNPYTAASAPILSILERLLQSQTLQPVEQLRAALEHELKAFYSQLDASNIHAEGISLAYFLISVTMDELIGKSYLRVYGHTHPFQAFTPQSFDEVPPEQRFFMLIEMLMSNPNQYLDLLELAYYCLLLGVEGKYHATPDGRQRLDELTEELYQIIKTHRCEAKKTWFQPQMIDRQSSKYSLSRPLVFALILTGMTIAFAWWASHYYVEHQLEKLLAVHHRVQGVSQA